ncbi:hypothetical protein WN944_009873 [Citrus x changshan-huyou]|uniref:Uncharacterized protein n=1 Tax=Citrus x changshan-huyou TaxID=2935761 RepID=A0AAP0MW39_9ROSI
MKRLLFATLIVVLTISITQASARVLTSHAEANAAAKQEFFGLFWPRFRGLPPLPSPGWVPPPLPARHRWPCPFPWTIPHHWLPSLPPLPSHH